MFYLGVDLGQTRDHSAISAVERNDYHGILMVRYVHRVPLGTPYPKVVRHIGCVVRHIGPCALAVDATGVGAPVVEMLREARISNDISAITITSGETETQRAGGWGVPQKDLIAGLQLSMERRELRLAANLKEKNALLRELVNMKGTTNPKGRLRLGTDGCGQHDDLVIALALACWRAKRPTRTVGFQPYGLI